MTYKLPANDLRIGATIKNPQNEENIYIKDIYLHKNSRLDVWETIVAYDYKLGHIVEETNEESLIEFTKTVEWLFNKE